YKRSWVTLRDPLKPFPSARTNRSSSYKEFTDSTSSHSLSAGGAFNNAVTHGLTSQDWFHVNHSLERFKAFNTDS
ncbi:hypothetical protein L9F63_002215, partial [Diploptera punctata]